VIFTRIFIRPLTLVKSIRVEGGPKGCKSSRSIYVLIIIICSTWQHGSSTIETYCIKTSLIVLFVCLFNIYIFSENYGACLSKNNTLQYCLCTFFFFHFFIFFTTNQHQNIPTFFTFLYHVNNFLLLFK
jgi:hypothetical protein